MDIKELNYLITLADEGNITHAAEKLYMAQSSLSHFVKQIESELDVSIFKRTSRGILLTAEGEILIQHARKMLAEFQSAKNEIHEMNTGMTGQIRLGVSTFRGTYILPSVFEQLHKKYPGITVILSELDSNDLEKEILEGNLDMALIALPLVNRSIYTEPCFRDEICIIAPEGHPLVQLSTHSANGKAQVPLGTISGFPFIFSSPSTVLGKMARKIFNKQGVKVQAYPTDVSPLLATALVKSRFGIAFSYRSWETFMPGLTYLSIAPEPYYVNLAIAYPHNGYRSKLCKVLEQLFKQYEVPEQKDIDNN